MMSLAGVESAYGAQSPAWDECGALISCWVMRELTDVEDEC